MEISKFFFSIFKWESRLYFSKLIFLLFRLLFVSTEIDLSFSISHIDIAKNISLENSTQLLRRFRHLIQRNAYFYPVFELSNKNWRKRVWFWFHLLSLTQRKFQLGFYIRDKQKAIRKPWKPLQLTEWLLYLGDGELESREIITNNITHVKTITPLDMEKLRFCRHNEGSCFLGKRSSQKGSQKIAISQKDTSKYFHGILVRILSLNDKENLHLFVDRCLQP